MPRREKSIKETLDRMHNRIAEEKDFLFREKLITLIMERYYPKGFMHIERLRVLKYVESLLVMLDFIKKPK